MHLHALNDRLMRESLIKDQFQRKIEFCLRQINQSGLPLFPENCCYTYNQLRFRHHFLCYHRKQRRNKTII